MENDIAKKLFEQEMMTMPTDDINKCGQGLYSLYASFLKAGFTEEQSMDLLKFSIANISLVGKLKGDI